MKNKAILVVSFGTSHLDTLEKNILQIENLVKDGYPNYSIYRAFTSKMIINKLKRTKTLDVDTVCEALERMLSDGFTDIIVMPTHIINGIENDNMTEDVKKYKDKFNSVKISTPLLTNTEDYFNVIDVLTDEYPIASDEALVLMGHGTEHYSNSAYPALDYMFKEKGYSNVYVGTVEGYPEIDDIIAKLSKENYKKVTLAPFMLVAGDHAKNDMAGDDEDSWKQLIINAGYEVNVILKGLGEIKGIQNIYLAHLAQKEK